MPSGGNRDFTQEYEYKLGFENFGTPPYAHVQTENVETEVEPSDVSLKSFRKQEHLADGLWDGDCLDKRARMRLMDIADDFWKTCDVGWTEPVGLILAGSICNYNWSEFSDIDLHLVVDFSKVHDREDFVQEYFNGKKNEWNDNHKSLRIYGFPVELYVQDKDAELESGGIYDLWEDKWLREPDVADLKPIELEKYRIKDLAADIMTKIDDLDDAFKDEEDTHRIEEIGEWASMLNDAVRKMRRKALLKGEMATGNIVYKVLRRTGYLERLWNLMDKVYDRTNSIQEQESFSRKVRRKFQDFSE